MSQRRVSTACLNGVSHQRFSTGNTLRKKHTFLRNRLGKQLHIWTDWTSKLRQGTQAQTRLSETGHPGLGKTPKLPLSTPWCNAVCKIREKLWQPKYPLVQHSLQNTRKNMATQIPPRATQLSKYEKKCGNPNTP